jgi:hypothetical protein
MVFVSGNHFSHAKMGRARMQPRMKVLVRLDIIDAALSTSSRPN